MAELTDIRETVRAREHRAELMSDRGYLGRVLLDGSATARAIAQDTPRRVSEPIHTQY